MNPKKIAWLQIGNAVLFAGLIIGAAWVLNGSEHWLTVQHLLIALWWIPFCLLLGQEKSCRCGSPKQSAE